MPAREMATRVSLVPELRHGRPWSAPVPSRFRGLSPAPVPTGDSWVEFKAPSPASATALEANQTSA